MKPSSPLPMQTKTPALAISFNDHWDAAPMNPGELLASESPGIASAH